MRCLLISVGSRGDAEPFEALSDMLLEMGHNVDFFLQPEHGYHPTTKRPDGSSAPKESESSSIAVHNLPFSTQDFYRVIAKPKHGQDQADPRVKFVGVVSEVISQLVLPCAKDVRAVCLDKKIDFIVCSSLARHLCMCIAKDLDIPLGVVHLQPLSPTKSFPHYSHEDAVKWILSSDESDEHLTQYWTYEDHYYEYLKDELDVMCRDVFPSDYVPPTLAEFRDMMSGKTNAPRVFELNCFSSSLCPATPHSDRVFDIGSLADTYISASFDEPPAELVEFLNEHKGDHSPVAIGFGSMPFSQAKVVVEGLESSDIPAVLIGNALSNYEETEWTKSNILVVSSVPYPWLFPRCRCMVSHGGAGVVHSTLRAGIPAIICPLMGDQFAWAKLLVARELGLDGGPMTSLTGERLVDCLAELDKNYKSYKVNTAKFAEEMEGKNAPKELVELIDSLASSVS